MGPFNIGQSLFRATDLTLMDQCDIVAGQRSVEHLRVTRAAMLRGLVAYSVATPGMVAVGASTLATTWVSGTAALTMAGYVFTTAREARELQRMSQEFERLERYRTAAVLTALRADVLYTLPNSRGRGMVALFDAVRLAAMANAPELCLELDDVCKRAIANRPLLLRPGLTRALTRVTNEVGKLPDARRRGMARLVLIHASDRLESPISGPLKLDAARDYIRIAGELGSDWMDPHIESTQLFAHQWHFDGGTQIDVALRQADELLRDGLMQIYRREGAGVADDAVRDLVTTEPARFVLNAYGDVLTSLGDSRAMVFRTLVNATQDPSYAAAIAVLGGSRTRPGQSELGRDLG